MKRINKKGQTEDFLADLIPSLIIILIGLYVLSNMQSANKLSTTEKGRAVNTVLNFEQKTITDYLSLKTEIDNKNQISMQDMISLSYQNKEYQSKLAIWLDKTGLAQLEAPIETIAQETKQEKVETQQFGEKECIQMDIQYPDSSSFKIGKECSGKEQSFYLPTFEGQYLKIKSIVGTKD